MYVLKNKKCIEKYKKFLCNWNFPKCIDNIT